MDALVWNMIIILGISVVLIIAFIIIIKPRSKNIVLFKLDNQFTLTLKTAENFEKIPNEIMLKELFKQVRHSESLAMKVLYKGFSELDDATKLIQDVLKLVINFKRAELKPSDLLPFIDDIKAKLMLADQKVMEFLHAYEKRGEFVGSNKKEMSRKFINYEQSKISSEQQPPIDETDEDKI